MGRETARRLANSPNMIHVEAVRAFSGTVQMTSIGSAATTADAATPAETTTVSATGLLGFTTVSVTVSADAAATTPVTGTVSRDGSSIGTFSVAATGQQTTTVTSGRHSTPLNAPTFTLNASVASNSTPVNMTVNREQRWV